MAITWTGGFPRIAWAQEKKRLVISAIFENREAAEALAQHVNRWNDRFVKLIIIEDANEYAVCCYQDPTALGEENTGVYRPGLPRISGYDQVKVLFKTRTPMFQVAYASDYTRMETYQQISRLVSPARSRIIPATHLRRQEFYYERDAISAYESAE